MNSKTTKGIILAGGTGSRKCDGWIDAAQLKSLAQNLGKNGYGEYLLGVLEEKMLR